LNRVNDLNGIAFRDESGIQGQPIVTGCLHPKHDFLIFWVITFNMLKELFKPFARVVKGDGIPSLTSLD
jgi:hypothetical protein